MSSFFRSVSDSEDSSSDEEEELTDSGSDSGLEGKAKKSSSAKKAKDSDDSDDDSDDDDSDDDSDADSDDDKKEEVKKPMGSRFLKGAASDDSDSDDERTKVVKSAKSKRADEVEACVKSIENAGKINDWSAISNGTCHLLLPSVTLFLSAARTRLFLSLAPQAAPSVATRGTDTLPLSPTTEFDKLVRLVSRQANVAEATPTAFVKALVSLDDTLLGAQGAKKKMNATNAKALNSMKQKLKKTQRDYEETIKKYKEVRFTCSFAASKVRERTALTLSLSVSRFV